MDLGLLGAHVGYANVRRTGFLGSKVVDRTVSVELSAMIADKQGGGVLLSRTFSRTMDDMVELSDIERLENPGIPATHGVLPGEGFFSMILEPVVAIGAVAIAVYLLFHVRS
jgi:hypothetical protein